MLYAAVAWNEQGYVVAMASDDAAAVRPDLHYPAERTADMVEQLRRLGASEPLMVVVESTCGIIDGRLMAAGLRVHRADPWQLPGRPGFGSVSATEIAAAARRDPAALTLLDRRRGTQTGREDHLDAGYAASASALEALTATGAAVWHGRRGGPEVALTFDDGPNPPYTDRILDVLERYEVPATFFCVGMNALAYPEQIARMREQGHALGNHTWSHPFLPELTGAEEAEQLERTDEAIAAAAGTGAPGLFRPPYGACSPEALDRLARTGRTVVLWDVDAEDWKMPGAEVIASQVLEATKPGSIILLHDGGGDRDQTAGALPAIIEGALAAGLRFSTVDALTTVGV